MIPANNSAAWVRRLRRFVDPPPEICELCRAQIADAHEHLIALPMRRLVCACESCAGAAPENGPRRFRRIFRSSRKLPEFAIADELWLSFDIPVEMAFFIREENRGLGIALYPGPAGLVQAELPFDAWSELVAQYRWLDDLVPETEALLVNRTHGAREYFRLSTDYCYALAGLMRSEWRGFGGGTELWNSLEHYFAQLSARADPHHA